MTLVHSGSTGKGGTREKLCTSGPFYRIVDVAVDTTDGQPSNSLNTEDDDF